MASLKEVVTYLDELLTPAAFSDYCPNGLQVQGRSEVRRVVGGVTACQALLDAAAGLDADAILVHHGYFWKNENPCVVGMKLRRLRTLIHHDMSLLAYHLPLDAHPRHGNNAQLGRRLGFEEGGPLSEYGDAALVWRGRLPRPLSPRALAQHVAQVLEREPLHIAGGRRQVLQVAWCTGAAQGFIEAAAAAGVDAYLTGEVSEPTVHAARELGLEFYAAGHHATERYGVQAVGEQLREVMGLEFEYVEVANPA
jgi:dinuclear metal center YbgI/SA1388 family protein